jgi:ubiquinone/menaquinone biosynthesis C-methylase UbiE
MSFDTLAPHYPWLEFVLAGEKLQRCRKAFLHHVPRAEHILLLGEGHGRSLVECRRRFEGARITCLDASKHMLFQAQRLLAKSGLESDRVEFINADALGWGLPIKTYDLIVTQFFLDCFRPDQLETLIARIATSATQNSHWLVADFQIPRKGWKRIRSRLIVWVMYLFFRVITRLPARVLTAPDPFLKHASFKLSQRVESEWGLLRSDWWQR